jgi:trk system potassium uptake protein TrkA
MNIVIVGAGKIGMTLAKKMAVEQIDTCVIESDPGKAAKASDMLDALVVEGNATRVEILKQANVGKADFFAALTTNDEVNLYTCKLARKMGAKHTIARTSNPEMTKPDFILTKEELGVDLIIHPEKETANAIITLIRQSATTDVVEFEDGKMQLMGLRLDKNAPVLHTPLKELGTKYGNPAIRVLAIKRGQYTIIPRGDDILLKGDQIFFISEPDFLPDALKYFGKEKQKLNDIMIIGGGKIGGFVAEELDRKVHIKVIELDQGKAERLAVKLPNTLVINGDGSSLDLLHSESLLDMDEFVAVTGDDETNIITSIVARHLEVPRTITLITKPEYLPLAPTLGMDAVISKQQITVNSIQRFIKSRNVANFAELPGVDADIIEFIANPNSKIVKKPLKDLHFPEGSIAGAIIKEDGSLEIPTGMTQIVPGDKVIVFTLPNVLKQVEKFF